MCVICFLFGIPPRMHFLLILPSSVRCLVEDDQSLQDHSDNSCSITKAKQVGNYYPSKMTSYPSYLVEVLLTGVAAPKETSTMACYYRLMCAFCCLALNVELIFIPIPLLSTYYGTRANSHKHSTTRYFLFLSFCLLQSY